MVHERTWSAMYRIYRWAHLVQIFSLLLTFRWIGGFPAGTVFKDCTESCVYPLEYGIVVNKTLGYLALPATFTVKFDLKLVSRQFYHVNFYFFDTAMLATVEIIYQDSQHIQHTFLHFGRKLTVSIFRTHDQQTHCLLYGLYGEILFTSFPLEHQILTRVHRL